MSFCYRYGHELLTPEDGIGELVSLMRDTRIDLAFGEGGENVAILNVLCGVFDVPAQGVGEVLRLEFHADAAADDAACAIGSDQKVRLEFACRSFHLPFAITELGFFDAGDM